MLRLLAVLLLLIGLAARPALADGPRVLRDAETERFLHLMTDPVLRAGGLDPESVTFILVDSPQLNAFVAGGQNIFINTGLILKSKSPRQLLGVLAHEAGHITGGHLVRSDKAMEAASAEAMLGTLAGILAGIATGQGGLMTIGPGMAQRSFFAFTRTQEGAADAAAIRFLGDAGYSADGLLEMFETLEGEELLPRGQQDPYLLTHPLTRDRIATLRVAVAAERGRKPLPQAVETGFARIQAKLLGYQNPTLALSRFKADSPDPAHRIGRAWALYSQKRMQESIALTDRLLAETPDDPWLLELKGQALLESGRAAEAVVPYRKAVALQPRSGLLQLALGHALLETGDPANMTAAVAALTEADRLEPNQSTVAGFLSQAYGRQGKELQARLYAAQKALLQRDKPIARRHAEWVLAKAPAGSREALKAQDILDAVRNE